MNSASLLPILADYQTLLAEIDPWFANCQQQFPAEIVCHSGCSGCCRGLFDITVLDAALLQQGFAQLPPATRAVVSEKAAYRLQELRALWPELDQPFILNSRPEEEWEELMPDEDETPCLLLDEQGHCLVYGYRPMTCRLHGLPLVDVSGEVLHDEWCTENFSQRNPLNLPALRGSFERIFRQEVALGRAFSRMLLGETVHELDTFIPLALLMDYRTFHWRHWWQENRERLLSLAQTTPA